MDDGDSRSLSEATSEQAAQQRLMVEISEEDGEWAAFAPLDAVIAAAAKALSGAPELGVPRAKATVALTSDARVRALNSQFRGLDKPTNVLSFPSPAGLPTDDDDRVFLGDIVLAAETVAAEARELGIPPAHHLQHLVIHGLLHLLGFDHQTDAEAERMEALETTLLASLGIADPFGEPVA